MISKFSVKKPYTVLVGVVMAIVLGVVSFTKMTTDLLPNISLPYVIVMTTYVGASPETVEMVVTKPVESSMATVSNIESISSVSSENYSMVILEFAQNADMNSVSLEIRENLDQIKSYWDDSVGNPIIMKLNPDMMPVMVAAVGKEGATNAEVSELAKNEIVPELESIEGVASANATGLLEESVNVIIRQDKIDAINRQVFGYIDSELEEKEQELADAKKELEDGKKEIEDGRSDLLDAQKELDDSKREIEENKADLEEGKRELEEGKRELADKKEEAVNKLAEAEAELLTAKADLEAAKINITSQLTLLDELQKKLEDAMGDSGGADSLTKIDEEIAQVDAEIAQTDAEMAQIDGEIAGLDEQIRVFQATIEYAGQYSDQTVEYVQASLDYNAPASGTVDEVKGVLNEYPNGETVDGLINSLQERISALEGEKGGREAGKAELEAKKNDLLMKKAELQLQKEQIEAIKAEIEDQLQQAGINISGFHFNFDEIKEEIRKPLGMIEENLEKVNAGLKELYKGNLKAATELANAQSKIDLGEFQMDLAENQLEAGEKQIESGQEQIDDGLEQLKDALEQLKDGEDQIKDGEEQLEDAREDAYASADMNDILTVDTVKSLLAAQNFSMPGGYVTEEGIDYLVRVGDKTANIEELAAMPIMNPDMDGVDVITLADVADVFMTDNSAEIYTNINGSPGILLTIQKQTGYSTGDVSDS